MSWLRTWRGLLVGLVVVLAAGAGLVWAASPQATTEHPGARLQGLQLAERTFACTGGPRGSRYVHGSPTVPPSGGPITSPRRLSVDSREGIGSSPTIPSAYAVQVAHTARYLAAGLCPEPASSWWFLGLGGSSTHDSVLRVDNPRAGDAIFDVRVYGAKGPVNVPSLRGIAVAGGKTRVLDLAKMAPSAGELAVHVTTSRGLVAVGASEDWSSAILGKPVGAFVPEQPAPNEHLDVLGLPGRAKSNTLLLLNPTKSVVVARLEVGTSTGAFAASGVQPVSVAPGGIASVKLPRAFAGNVVRVAAPAPLFAVVRAVAGNDETYAAAGSPLSGSTVSAVPFGSKVAKAALVVAGSSKRETLTLEEYDATGIGIGSRRIVVPPNGTQSVSLHPRTRSITVTPAHAGTLSAALVFEGPAGVAGLPITSVAHELLLPAVLPVW